MKKAASMIPRRARESHDLDRNQRQDAWGQIQQKAAGGSDEKQENCAKVEDCAKAVAKMESLNIVPKIAAPFFIARSG